MISERNQRNFATLLQSASIMPKERTKEMQKSASIICTLACLLALAGCMTPQPSEGELQREHTRSTAREDLKEGIDAYNAGDYNGSLKILLDSKTIWITDNTIQLEALRYSAFDYCLTSRASQCKLQFEKALLMDPNFDLRLGEKGHPMWGPAFDKAKKAVANQ